VQTRYLRNSKALQYTTLSAGVQSHWFPLRQSMRRIIIIALTSHYFRWQRWYCVRNVGLWYRWRGERKSWRMDHNLLSGNRNRRVNMEGNEIIFWSDRDLVSFVSIFSAKKDSSSQIMWFLDHTLWVTIEACSKEHINTLFADQFTHLDFSRISVCKYTTEYRHLNHKTSYRKI